MAALQQTVRKFFPFITQKQKTKQIQRTEVTLCPSDTIANCGYLLAASTVQHCNPTKPTYVHAAHRHSNLKSGRKEGGRGSMASSK